MFLLKILKYEKKMTKFRPMQLIHNITISIPHHIGDLKDFVKFAYDETAKCAGIKFVKNLHSGYDLY